MTKEQATLEEYLRNGVEFANVIDYAIRAQIEDSGHVTFYIRPQDANGDTLDFEVSGNLLYPNRRIIRIEQ